jgi:hypothetical protein
MRVQRCRLMRFSSFYFTMIADAAAACRLRRLPRAAAPPADLRRRHFRHATLILLSPLASDAPDADAFDMLRRHVIAACHAAEPLMPPMLLLSPRFFTAIFAAGFCRRDICLRDADDAASFRCRHAASHFSPAAMPPCRLYAAIIFDTLFAILLPLFFDAFSPPAAAAATPPFSAAFRHILPRHYCPGCRLPCCRQRHLLIAVSFFMPCRCRR